MQVEGEEDKKRMQLSFDWMIRVIFYDLAELSSKKWVILRYFDNQSRHGFIIWPYQVESLALQVLPMIFFQQMFHIIVVILRQ